MAVRKRRSKALPSPNEANPYMVERKAAMLRAKITAVDVWLALEVDRSLSVATVREVINGTFRNDSVIAAFTKLTGIARSAAFPASELEWISKHRKAERSVLEAAG